MLDILSFSDQSAPMANAKARTCTAHVRSTVTCYCWHVKWFFGVANVCDLAQKERRVNMMHAWSNNNVQWFECGKAKRIWRDRKTGRRKEGW